MTTKHEIMTDLGLATLVAPLVAMIPQEALSITIGVIGLVTAAMRLAIEIKSWRKKK